uniref:NAC domain-containing protein 83-like n=1 Tax=Erigeron canadensis TaxID=72917 RepID=UPI001CB95CCE|nr:NAC domain-containing protein 83-like [Erigeron canadensis]
MSIEDKNHAEDANNCIKAKLGLVRNGGGVRLPPGFRFQPTDHEIVFQYLVRKVFSCPLPASIIPEINNICKFNPWDLPGEWEQERYFFSKKEAKYGHGSRVNRKSSDGYWKATSIDKHITRCCSNNVISKKKETVTGMKKTLVFYKSKPSTTRTHWIMHEYRLVLSPTSPSTTTSNDKKSWIQLGDWVLCHVLLNKRSQTSSVEDDSWKRLMGSRDRLAHQRYARNDAILIGYNEASSCSSSSSSCSSSVVTHEEVSSSKKSLDYYEETKNV